MADAQFRHARLETGNEILRDAFLHEEPGSGTTDLALVEPDRIDETFDRAVDIGIVEDDIGRLAAKLQSERLAGAGGFLADEAADLGRAGEGDLVDILVLDEGGTRF